MSEFSDKFRRKVVQRTDQAVKVDRLREEGEGAYVSVSLQRARFTSGQLRLRLKVVSYPRLPRHDLHVIVSKFRDDAVLFRFPVRLRRSMKPTSLIDYALDFLRWKRFPLTRARADVIIDLPWAELENSIYGVYFESSIATRAVSTNQQSVASPQSGVTLCLYPEPLGGKLRIDKYSITSDDVSRIRAGLVRAQDQSFPRKKVLFGEYTNSARDNARALFDYATGQPESEEVDFTYVIEASSPDRWNLSEESTVLFGTREHFDACVGASVITFTHHAHYPVPGLVTVLDPTYFLTRKTFFLQHGVTALKNVFTDYRKIIYDGYLTTSPLETAVFRASVGVSTMRIHELGFPRWGAMHDRQLASSRDTINVFAFPTWRPDLVRISQSDFEATDFFKRWHGLAVQVSTMEGYNLTLGLHPNISHFRSLFDLNHVRLSEEWEIQQVLADSDVLVTDFSSLCWDAAALGIPSLFWLSSREIEDLRATAFIKIPEALPGPTVSNLKQLRKALAPESVSHLSASAQEQARLRFTNRGVDPRPAVLNAVIEMIAEAEEARALEFRMDLLDAGKPAT